MSVHTDANGDEWTSISVPKPQRDRLREMKPYDSISYSDLLDEMIEAYEAERGQ